MPVTTSFAADPASVAASRHFVREALSDWPSDLIDAAELLTSEVVTNAVVHARSPVEVALLVSGGSLVVEVTDESDELPLLEPSKAGLNDHGRGLWLVSDMSNQWGVIENDSGKTVWFRLPKD